MTKIDDCTICFEPFDSTTHRSVVLHNCGHIFGRPCIFGHFYLRKNANKIAPCPLCNAEFTKDKIGPLFIPTIVEKSATKISDAKNDKNGNNFDEWQKLKMAKLKIENKKYEEAIVAQQETMERNILDLDKANQYRLRLSENLAHALSQVIL